jgi:putative membrane protein insertion efficiency factor
MIQKLFVFLIKFYQKYLSIISFGSCRYYPTCSNYSLVQFEHNNFFVALYYSSIRILKCNPLFVGGFDHPCIKLNPHKVEFKKIRVKFWYIPKDENNYFILQNWKKNYQDNGTNDNEQQST